MLTTAPNTFTAEGRARRALPVEDVLRWAIVHELPKRERDRPIKAPLPSGMHPMWRGGIFGGRIDNWSREPGMPRATGEPHPDALLIEREVAALESAIKAAGESWSDLPLREKGKRPEPERAALPLNIDGYCIGYRLGRDAKPNQAAADAILSVCSWLVTHAITGKRPDLDEDVFFEPVVGEMQRASLWASVSRQYGEDAQGNPLFVTSVERTTMARGGEYRDGTHCKMKWLRDHGDIAEDRARYAAWHAALCYLADRLGHLTSLKVTPPRAPAAPWLSGPTEPATVRPSLVPVNDDRAPEKVATLPPRKRKPEPVRHIDPAVYAAAA